MKIKEKLKFIDKITVTTDPSTVAKPLAPQAQPMVTLSYSSIFFIPDGKKTPSGIPIIKIRNVEIISLKSRGIVINIYISGKRVIE